MIARNNPIPAPTPNFILTGILLIIHCLAGVIESIKNTIPATNTAARACWYVYPIPKTTPKAKKALRPIPGASAIGQLAHTPMIKQPTIDAIMVATKTPPKSIPVPSVESIAGFTTMM